MSMPSTRRLAQLAATRMATLAIVLSIVAGCANPLSKGSSKPASKPAAPAPVAGESNTTPAVPQIDEIEIGASSTRLFEQALEAVKAQRYSQAETLLQELTVKEPKLSTPWFNLGKVYQALGREPDAVDALRKAVQINPQNCPAYNELGVLARQDGDFTAAEESYLSCIRQVPAFRDAYLNLGILYELYLGRLPDALAAYRQYQALSGSPDRRVQGWVMDLERRIGKQS